ncbi:MAG: tRNA modification GTPase [Rubripirellula sp.]|nr:tRNA modification GTPase [Rubripirellula sp.]
MTLVDVEDTIVAIATPGSPAPRGAVRLSGQQLSAVLQRLMPEHQFSGSSPRRMDVQFDLGTVLGDVPVSLMWWPTHRSYTAQPSAELHTFGSLPILTAIVRRAIDAGARAARPGEFTMRAFLAGRLDLTQAEAVLGVIEAEGRGSLDHALEQLSGNLSKPLEQARTTVLNLLADVEAGLDFVDEDIEFIDRASLRSRLDEILLLLRQTAETMRHRGGGADRPMVALRGLPNAGKSYLFNRLSNQDAAIVSDVAGTTRDAVTCEADVGGKQITLSDTAGLESIDTEISERAQVQGQRASQLARVRLWCVDASRPDFEHASEQMREIASAHAKSAVSDLFLATKVDQSEHPVFAPWIGCSAVTGEGIELVVRQICEKLDQTDQQEIGSVVGTAARCGHALQLASEAAEAAVRLIELNEGQEFVATELRAIAVQLGEVTGAVYTDDILDRVFSRFCIGK